MSLTRRRSASLGCLTLIAVFFFAVIAFGLAYQAKPGYSIDVGTRLDEAYLADWRTKEPAEKERLKPDWDGFSYRFTNAESKIDLPGLGSQPLSVTMRVMPSLNPNPSLKVIVNEKYQVPDQYLKISPGEVFQEITFPIPPNAFADGNLHLKLLTPTWKPADVIKGSTDKRELGLLVDWVKIEPNIAISTGLIRPPNDIFIPLVISSLLVLLIFFAIGLPPLYALLGSGLAIGGVSYWLVFDRLNLTELISKDFIRSLFFIWVAVYLAAEFGPKLYRAVGIAVNRREAGWLAGFFLLNLVLLLGVALHPQFTSSDLGLNIHLLQKAQAGQLIFPQQLPTGQLAPYPPAYYYLLLPFTSLTGGDDAPIGALIKIASALLQASEIFFVFYLSALLRRPLAELAHREWDAGTNWAGLCAAAFYTVCKYPYYIFSQGNHANLFGLWALLLFVCITVGTLTYLRDLPFTRIPAARPDVLSQPVRVTRRFEASSVALYEAEGGKVFASPNYIKEEQKEIQPPLSKRYFDRLLIFWRQSVWPILAVTLRYLVPLALLLLVFLAHYGTFLFANVFMLGYVALLGLLGGKAGRRDALYLLLCYIATLLLSFLLYYNNVADLLSAPGAKSKTDLSAEALGLALRKFWSDLVFQFGLIIVLAAIGGIALWLIRPNWTNFFRHLSPVAGALLSLTAATMIFALLNYVIGENRFQLYLLPLVSLAAGAFFGRIWQTGWAGILAVSAVFLFQLLEVIAFWLYRITYYF